MLRIARRLCLIAAAGLMCLAQAAADGVTGSADGGYGRLLFTLTPSDHVTAQTTGTVLTIGFARKVALTPEAVAQALPNYIASGHADADGKTFRFVLSQPVRLHTSSAAGKFAVDLAPSSYTATPPDLPKPAPAAPTVVDVSKLPVLKVRAGAYQNFTRVVFDWPRQVPYSVYPGSGMLTIRFEAQASPDFSAIDRQAPPWVKSAGWHIAGRGMVVDLAIDTASGYHDFRDGSRVVIDVLAPKTDADAYNPPGIAKPQITLLANQKPAAAQRAKAAPPKPATPTAQVAHAQPIATGAPAKLGPNALMPQPNKFPGAAQPAPVAPNNSAAVVTPATATTDATTDATAASSNAVQAADGKLTREGAVLLFPGAGRRPAAVFIRGLMAWIILENSPPLDAVKLKSQLGSFPVSVDGASSPGMTMLRIGLRQPQSIAAIAEGANLKVVIASQTNSTSVALGFARNQENPTHSTISTLLPGAAKLERVVDPDAGDELLVIPGYPGRDVASERTFVEFAALPTAAGMVVMPYVDDLSVGIDAARITITRPGGLSLTPALMPANASNGSAGNPCFLDYAHWRIANGGTFLATERRLRAAISRLSPENANKGRLTLARFYLANGFAAEALGIITIMQAADPGLQSDLQLQTMRAAASLAMGRPRDALNAISGSQFDTDRHAALWRGLTQAALENWDAARINLERAAPIFKAYEPDMQIRARLASIEAALGTSHLEVADAELERLPEHLDGRLGLQLTLDRARLYAAERRRGRSAKLFAAVENSGDDYFAARAIYFRVTSELRNGALKPQQAINALERLRFRWRGDLLELKTLRALASIYFGQKRWREGLDTLRIATQYFPNEDTAMQAQDDMRATFVELFLHGKADSLPPIQALALFYDFIELTPLGADGDEMIRHMADRLVKVDLLGPAADLLNYQVTKRLDGVARAQVATRLAMVQLMDHKPQAVLDTLQSTQISTLPDEVAHQRLLMQARALADEKRYDQALDLLAVDQQPDTVHLRADIYWQSGQWEQAGQKAEEALGTRYSDATPLTDGERQDVMRAAVAYSLANDQPSLDRLRTNFMPKLRGTPDASGFAVVTERIDLQGVAFRDAAAKVASIDTLQTFMQDIQKKATN
jgi:hypothetical protein